MIQVLKQIVQGQPLLILVLLIPEVIITNLYFNEGLVVQLLQKLLLQRVDTLVLAFHLDLKKRVNKVSKGEN